MIYLITGRNGSGKTQLVLRALLSDPRFKGRPVVFRGVPLLRAAFRRLRILASFDAEDSGWLSHWWELVTGPADGPLDEIREIPPGTLFVLDESWDLLGGARGAAGRDHPWVNPLKTHRHFGLDFVFIGQGIKDFPPVLRELAAEHWHVSRVAGKLRVLVWQNRCGDPDSMVDVGTAERLPWEPKAADPEAWSLYHSADLHTPQVGRGGRYFALRRRAMVFAALALLTLCGVVWGFMHSDAFVLLGLRDPAPPVEAAAPGASVSGSPDVRISSLDPGVSAEIAGAVQVWGQSPGAAGGFRDSSDPPEWLSPGAVRAESGSPDCSVLVARRGARDGELISGPSLFQQARPSVLDYPVDYFRSHSDPLDFPCDVPLLPQGDGVMLCPGVGPRPDRWTSAAVVWSWELTDCSVGVDYWTPPAPPEPRRRARRRDDDPDRSDPSDEPRAAPPPMSSGAPFSPPRRSRVRYEGGIDESELPAVPRPRLGN